MKHLFFHFIGFCSVISLAMLVVLIAPGAFQGNFEVVKRFFEQHPGSQPFIIFILPVILICGPAWLFRLYIDWKIGSKEPHA